MEIPDHLTCLLKNLYAVQEETVRTLYGTTDWFRIEKGVQQGCLLSPCLFNLYAEYTMRNARLDELQAGIKTAGRNINNKPKGMTHSLKITMISTTIKNLMDAGVVIFTPFSFYLPI